MTTMPIRDVSLFVKVIGQGYPLRPCTAGLGLDYTSLLPLEPLEPISPSSSMTTAAMAAPRGRQVSSMTWENLTADADALRQTLGFERWAVLGHSFGGNVALEYALRYPQHLSHLILMNTGGDQWWVQQNAPDILAKRGYSAGAVQAARRFYSGQIAAGEFYSTFMRFMPSTLHNDSLLAVARETVSGFRHPPTMQPKALIGYSQLLNGWTVMDRLSEIKVPTPAHCRALSVFPGICWNIRLSLRIDCLTRGSSIIERAGHSPHAERRETLPALRRFLTTAAPSSP